MKKSPPKMKYWDQLRRPEWQQRKMRILERDKWTCRQCSAKDKMLHVHHRYYVSGRLAWEYPDIALLTICEECHDWHSRETLEAHGVKPETKVEFEEFLELFDGFFDEVCCGRFNSCCEDIGKTPTQVMEALFKGMTQRTIDHETVAAWAAPYDEAKANSERFYAESAANCGAPQL